ncbi:hypothetical protein [Kribbella sp. NPDC006257]|uniref:hypothetical protein n=1 Tax=Kribbella sp. NPDC006257 TaxID=3156738 RepID=UPI0033B1D484
MAFGRRLDRTPWQTAELVQRLQASDATPVTLERLHATLAELCCQYSWRDALELREEAQGWLRYVGELLRRPVGLRAHTELLTAGGWLPLLAGCVQYDLGLRAAAESTRTAALQLGAEAGHPESAAGRMKCPPGSHSPKAGSLMRSSLLRPAGQ